MHGASNDQTGFFLSDRRPRLCFGFWRRVGSYTSAYGFRNGTNVDWYSAANAWYREMSEHSIFLQEPFLCLCGKDRTSELRPSDASKDFYWMNVETPCPDCGRPGGGRGVSKPGASTEKWYKLFIGAQKAIKANGGSWGGNV